MLELVAIIGGLVLLGLLITIIVALVLVGKDSPNSIINRKAKHTTVIHDRDVFGSGTAYRLDHGRSGQMIRCSPISPISEDINQLIIRLRVGSGLS